MNNKEILEINKLKQELEENYKTIKKLTRFYKLYKLSFKKEESIEALKKIKTYIENEIAKNKEITIEIKNIAKTLEPKCNHHIIIKEILRYSCPICKTTYEYSNIPEKTLYIIEGLYNNEELNYIDNVIINSDTEEETEQKILDYLNQLQYEKNIKIRRKTK